MDEGGVSPIFYLRYTHWEITLKSQYLTFYIYYIHYIVKIDRNNGF